jgi:L-amino acid N-acyltransferase YncA
MLTDDDSIIAPWVMERTGDNFPMGVAGAIGVMDDDKVLAGVVFDHLTPVCVTATIAVDNCMLPRRLIRAMFNYPFRYLGVKKILVYVSEANRKSIELAIRLGFKVEAIIKDVYAEGSMLIMSLLKQDCIWIRSL